MESKLTKEIQTKFYNVWEKLETYIITNYDEIDIFNSSDDELFICFKKTTQTLPFSLLYALLKNFFKTHNIKIVNCYRCDEEKWYPEIYTDNFPEYIEFENVFGDENDCEYFSIIKASEILNNRG